MDVGPHIGLGHRDRLGQVQLALHLFRQDRRFIGAAQNCPLRVAQHAQTVAGLGQGGLGLIGAVSRARIVVVASAEEDEVVGIHPLQEGDVLGDDGVVEAFRGALQMGDRASHQGLHGGVIGHGGMDVGQGRGQGAGQVVAAFLRQGIGDHHDDRLSAGIPGNHRVEHGPHGDAGLGHLTHDAIDQEGSVVLDDEDQIIRGDTAAGARERTGDDAGRFPRRPGLGRAPGGGQNGGEIITVDLGRFVGGVVFMGLGDEGLFADAARLTAEGAGEPVPERLQRRGLGGHGRSAGHGQGLFRRGAGAAVASPMTSAHSAKV